MTSSSRVLITGSTGFVGQWLTKTRPPDTIIYGINRAKYEAGDWKYQTWDYIIHLAPTPPTDVLACGARVLYASSGAVLYPGNWARKRYIDDKIKYEKECIDSGVDVVVARLFTFYGEGLDKFKAITTFIEAAKKNEVIRITGDGGTVRTYMSGADMGRRMWRVLLKGVRGDAYEIGSTKQVTMLELAKHIVRHYKSKSDIVILGGVDPMPFYVPQNTQKTDALMI